MDGLKARLTQVNWLQKQVLADGLCTGKPQVSEVSWKGTHMYSRNIGFISDFFMAFLSTCATVNPVFHFLFCLFGVCEALIL